jgi:hypothetical protein
MKLRFGVYDDVTGEILRVGHCPLSELAGKAGTGETSIEVAADVSDATHYFSGSPIAAIARPASTITIDTEAISAGASPEDVATISNIPNPTNARVKDANGRTTETITDGTLEIVSDVADTIWVEMLSAFPELAFSAEIVAT